MVTRKGWTLTAVILGSGIVFLDSTVVNVALPQIGDELKSENFGTLEAQAYVYYGYLLTLSSLLILAGAATDHFGRRRMFAFGLAGFGVTSVMCGLAPSMELLIASRVLQGAAGAVLVPGSLSIITATFSGEEQGRAFGVWAGASAATTILGPIVGGAFVAYVSWRAAFFINVPLIAIALWATLRKIEETRDEDSTGRFDLRGAVVVAVAVGGLTFGTIRGQAQGWGEPSAITSLILGALATVTFPILMARTKDPLVPLDMFRSRNFSVTNVSTFIIYGALYVTFQYFALFAIGTIGYNPLAFGLAGLPGELFLAAFSAKFGALAARFGPRWFMAVGPAIMGLGLLWFTRFPATSEPWVPSGSLGDMLPPRSYFVDVLPALLLFGIGLMVMVAPLTMALMRSIPVRHSGVGSAVNNAISRVGPQLLGALLFIVITGSFYANFVEHYDGDITITEQFKEEVAPLNPPTGTPSPDIEEASRAASTDAFRFAMAIAAGLCFVGAAVNGIGISNEDALGASDESEGAEQQAV